MKTSLLLVSAFALAAGAATAGTPATGGPYMSAMTRSGPDTGNHYSSAYASGPTGDRGTDSQLRDGRVRCQRMNGRLMLVNVSGTTFPAHAYLRYAVGKGQAHNYYLRAPLPTGDGIALPETVGTRFDCAAAVRF